MCVCVCVCVCVCFTMFHNSSINVFSFPLKAWVSVATLISIASWFQMRGAVTEKARSSSFSLISPGNKVIVACRAVRSSARYQRRRLNQILDLEFNPLLNGQPMERSECCIVVHVVELRKQSWTMMFNVNNKPTVVSVFYNYLKFGLFWLTCELHTSSAFDTLYARFVFCAVVNNVLQLITYAI